MDTYVKYEFPYPNVSKIQKVDHLVNILKGYSIKITMGKTGQKISCSHLIPYHFNSFTPSS